MKHIIMLAATLTLILGSFGGWAMREDQNPFVPNVAPATGAIHVPDNSTAQPTLDTYTYAKVEGSPGLQE